jgi:hypothetical protein
MMRWLSMVVVSSVMLAVGAVEARAQPIPVFIQAVNEPVTAKPRELEAAAEAAEARMRSLRDTVHKEHGYKRAAWSAQTVDAVDTAENAAQLARAQFVYSRDAAREGLDGVVADLVREVGAAKNPQMAVVTKRDDAALVIDVVGRLIRAMNLSSPTDNRYFLRLRVRPGPGMSEERFRQASAGYTWGPDLLTKAFARPTMATTYWEAEVGHMASFDHAARGAVRAVLDSFVKGVAAPALR